MAMDRTHSIKSLTDDILQAVESRSSLDKTASAVPKEMHTPIGREFMQIAADLRKLAEDPSEITFDDLRKFASDMEGVL